MHSDKMFIFWGIVFINDFVGLLRVFHTKFGHILNGPDILFYFCPILFPFIQYNFTGLYLENEVRSTKFKGIKNA